MGSVRVGANLARAPISSTTEGPRAYVPLPLVRWHPGRVSDQRAWAISLTILATEAEADSDASAYRASRVLCAEPEHQGPCPTPWSITRIAVDDLEPPERDLWQDSADGPFSNEALSPTTACSWSPPHLCSHKSAERVVVSEIAEPVAATIWLMGTCERCGEQIVWDDGDWITLDGIVACAQGGGEHRLARVSRTD